MTESIANRELNIGDIHVVMKTIFGTKQVSRLEGRYSDCFFYVLTGSADYEFNDKKLTANANDIFYLAKDSRYTISNISGYSVVFVDFDFVDASSVTRKSELFHDSSLESTLNLFMKLKSLWQTQSPAYKTQSKALLYSIYYQLIVSKNNDYIPTSKRYQLEKAVELVNLRYSDSDLSSAEIAVAAGISEVHLRRLFKRIYHMSPMRYLTSVRIGRAKELLVEKDLSVGEVSEACGYSSLFYFSRIFKSETGMTPSEYKKILG